MRPQTRRQAYPVEHAPPGRPGHRPEEGPRGPDRQETTDGSAVDWYLKTFAKVSI
jgi:hypothetical protein